ncbi:hypothetical protein HQN87_19440 [Paenibacillus tritici]|uniref:Polymerase nucleotidyl transferase domain-containing protein n=1 Tax=Paenibacillus tritici TaxID=1873425 RepID=A0ABX2DSE0_9BACL|nr:hypothetical protein [Paenibacillus tritici]NQX47512.1 hypothetical protein [Paenibacillus tritici]
MTASLSNLLLKPDNHQQNNELLQEIGSYILTDILNHPLIVEDSMNISILLDGSTALGIVDDISDIDIILICREECYESITGRFERAGLIPEQSSLFVDVHLPGGKTGHYTLLRLSGLEQALLKGQMDWLWNASVSCIYHDPLDVKALFAQFLPLPPELLMSIRKNAYIDLRSAAKSLDNPVRRGAAFPILFQAVEVFKWALRCAITVEGYPYPYDKWLVPVAEQLPVGKRVLDCMNDFWLYLREDASYVAMYQEDNSFVKMEKRVRKVLLEELRLRGIEEPWLVEWWKYMEG